MRLSKTLLYLKSFLILWVSMGVLSPVQAENPWVKSFTPLREFYVSPDGLNSNQIIDYSGSNNTGELNGQPIRTTGHIFPPSGEGNALQFDGIDDFAELNTPVAPWGSNASIEAWIKTADTSHPHINFPILGMFLGASAGGHGQSFGVRDGKLSFSVSENANPGCEDESVHIVGSLVADNNWHHVVATIDQTNNMVHIYLDGNLDGSADVSQIDDTGCRVDDMSFIGATNPFSSWPNQYFTGILDEVRVYDRVLTASEIINQFNSGIGQYGLPEPNLVAGWHMDETVEEGTLENPLDLTSAIQTAQPGDLYWLTEGTYNIGPTILTQSGTSSNPIVYRAMEGAHAKIYGRFKIEADYNWIWGLEVTYPEVASGNPDGIGIFGAGVHLIDNNVHAHPNANGIGAWNYPDQIIYGNILYDNGVGDRHPHNIYAQNDFDTNGLLYVVNNFLLDSSDSCGNCFNFHGYATLRNDPEHPDYPNDVPAFLTGFYLKGNVSANGPFLIGGYNRPPQQNVITENYFYASNAQNGYRRPTQVEFTNNYLGRSEINTLWFWGTGETIYTQSKPNVYTGNESYYLRSNQAHVRFRTSAYTPARLEGIPAIQPTDIINNNTYSAPFKAIFWANGNNENNGGSITFNQWKTASAAAGAMNGNGFDKNSTVAPNPLTPRIFVTQDEYDPKRSHLIIFNWGQSGTVQVNLDTVLMSGTNFKIVKPKDFFGTPVVTGSYNGNVSIPTGGEEFLLFVVLNEGEPPPLDTTPPSVPSGLAATPFDGHVNLSWTANTDDTVGYNLYRQTNGTGNFDKQNGTPLSSNSYADPNVTNNIPYSYRVSAGVALTAALKALSLPGTSTAETL